MILINGQADDRISVLDRGMQYGDGVFETIAYRQGKIEFWQPHLDRLIAGCQRLNIHFDANQQALLHKELQSIMAQLNEDAVVKIILTRGQGGRGYYYSANMQPSRIISTHPMPSFPVANLMGIKVRICNHCLPVNPFLAGIKHLNRLDQILARNEWDDEEIAEGLMIDQHGNFIEGTMSNLFMVKNDTLFTPDISGAGIAGIMRQQILLLAQQLGWSVTETTISMDDLLSAQEIFLCNSLIGIWPVTHMDGVTQNWLRGKMTHKLQLQLAELKH